MSVPTLFLVPKPNILHFIHLTASNKETGIEYVAKYNKENLRVYYFTGKFRTN